MDESATAVDLALYRQRQTFALFEVACLLHGKDPDKLMRNLRGEALQRDRDQGIGAADPKTVIDLLYALVQGAPEMALGDALGGTLRSLMKGVGIGAFGSVPSTRAPELAKACGLAWPVAIGQEFRETPPRPVQSDGDIYRTSPPGRTPDALAPVITEARAYCGTKASAAEVYARLQQWASEGGHPPLLGARSGYIEWSDRGQKKPLTPKNLRDRIGRAKTREDAQP